MPKTQEVIIKSEGFKYAISLDLNMGYYNIRLTAETRILCTSILLWGKYNYKQLTMGVCNYPENFQGKTNEMFQGFKYIHAYLDDLLVLAAGNWTDNLTNMEQVFIKL